MTYTFHFLCNVCCLVCVIRAPFSMPGPLTTKVCKTATQRTLNRESDIEHRTLAKGHFRSVFSAGKLAQILSIDF